MGTTYEPDNDAQNLQEEMYQYMLLTINEFDIDDRNAFPHLQAATTGTSAYVHIETY